MQCSKFTFLYNETLENIINYELGIEKVFYKSLSLNKLKMENEPRRGDMIVEKGQAQNLENPEGVT